jgi:hypothetical protein
VARDEQRVDVRKAEFRLKEKAALYEEAASKRDGLSKEQQKHSLVDFD